MRERRAVATHALGILGIACSLSAWPAVSAAQAPEPTSEVGDVAAPDVAAPDVAAPDAPPPTPRISPTLLVAVNVDGAQVLIDGAPIGDAPIAPIELDAGSHELTVSAPGHDPWSRRFELTESGLRIDVRLVVSAAAAEVTPEDDPTWTSGSASKPLWKRWYLWAGVGAVVVLATIIAVAAASGGGSAQEGFPVPPIPGRMP